MEMLLSSARSERSKQTPVKAKNPPKATTSSKKQPVREVHSKKVVQLISQSSGTDAEDNETLATLRKKKRYQKTMKRAAQKKDSDNEANKDSCEEVNPLSDQELFVTQKMSTVEPSQISATQHSDPDRDDMWQSNEEQE